MIIDVHCHYLPEELLKVFNKSPDYADRDNILRCMDQGGIYKSVLLFPGGERPSISGGWSNACRIFNDAVSRLAAGDQSRFIGACILPVDDAVHMGSELEWIKSKGFKIISLLSSYDGVHLDDKQFHQIYDFANLNQLTVYVHPQTDFKIPSDSSDDLLIESAISPVFDMAITVSKMITAGIFLKYDNVKFVFSHAGAMMAVLKNDLDEEYAYFRRSQQIKDVFMRPSEYLKNVYWETGGGASELGMKIMVESLNFRRILFGSNYPRSAKIKYMYAALEKAIPDEQERSFVLSQNAVNVLGLY